MNRVRLPASASRSEDSSDFAPRARSESGRRRLLRALSRRSANERTLLALLLFERLTLGEAAAALDTTPADVEARMRDLRAQLGRAAHGLPFRTRLLVTPVVRLRSAS